MTPNGDTLVRGTGPCTNCKRQRYRNVYDDTSPPSGLCNICRSKAGEKSDKGELLSIPFSVHDDPGRPPRERTTPASTEKPSEPALIMVGKCKVCGKKMYKPAGVRGRNPKKHKNC